MSEKTLREACEAYLVALDAQRLASDADYDTGTSESFAAYTDALDARQQIEFRITRRIPLSDYDMEDSVRRLVAALDAAREAGRAEEAAKWTADWGDDARAEGHAAGRREALEEVRAWLSSLHRGHGWIYEGAAIVARAFNNRYPKETDHD